MAKELFLPGVDIKLAASAIGNLLGLNAGARFVQSQERLLLPEWNLASVGKITAYHQLNVLDEIGGETRFFGTPIFEIGGSEFYANTYGVKISTKKGRLLEANKILKECENVRNILANG